MADDTTDSAAERVRAFLRQWDESVANGQIVTPETVSALWPATGPVALAAADLRALLDERKQLREAVRLEREAFDQRGAVVHQVRSELHGAWKERNAATTRAEAAEAALEALRGQLGETRAEWGARGGGGTFHVFDEAEARWQARRRDEPMTAVTRLVGEWRVAEEGGEPT